MVIVKSETTDIRLSWTALH